MVILCILTGDFRMADIYFLFKGREAERWRAIEVKMILEWLTDTGLAKRKLVKAGRGQKWLFYRACYAYEFLLGRTELFCDIQAVKYKCQGHAVGIRYLFVQINEKAYCKRELEPCRYLFGIGL